MRISYRLVTSNVRSNENDKLERRWPEGLFTYSRCSYTIRRKKQGNLGKVMNHSISSASRIPKHGPVQYQVDFLICQLGTVPTCTPLRYYSSAWSKVLFFFKKKVYGRSYKKLSLYCGTQKLVISIIHVACHWTL